MIELSHTAGPIFTGVDGTLLLYVIYFATLAPFVFGAWALLLCTYSLIRKIIGHPVTIQKLTLPAIILLVFLWILSVPAYQWYDKHQLQAGKNATANAKLKKAQFEAELPQLVAQTCQSKKEEIQGLKATAQEPTTYYITRTTDKKEDGLYIRYKSPTGKFTGYGIRELRFCPGVTPIKNNRSVSVYSLATGHNLTVNLVEVDASWYATRAIVE